MSRACVPYKLVRPDAVWHFVLYDRPHESPNSAVVRGWIFVAGVDAPIPTDWVALYATVDQAQAELAQSPDLHRVPRAPDDDPSIVECWL